MSGNADTRWTVAIETFEGLTASVPTLERFAEALEANPKTLGPAASLDRGRGILSATFQVAARTQGVAADRGIEAFYDALASAGYDVERPGWKLKLEIEPHAEESKAVPVRS